eukprot:5917021-Lingulodinium_polyedra.AAC.1
MRRSRARLPSAFPGCTPLQSMKIAYASTTQRSSARERPARSSGRSETNTVSPRYWRESLRSAH